jgi:hypothetical protein
MRLKVLDSEPKWLTSRSTSCRGSNVAGEYPNRYIPPCEISGSHGGEYENVCLVGRCALRNALMMEAAITYETSVNFYQTTRRNNPEDTHLQIPTCTEV